MRFFVDKDGNATVARSGEKAPTKSRTYNVEHPDGFQGPGAVQYMKFMAMTAAFEDGWWQPKLLSTPCTV